MTAQPQPARRDGQGRDGQGDGAAGRDPLSDLLASARMDARRLLTRARSDIRATGDPRRSSPAADAAVAAGSARLHVAEAVLYPAARRALADGPRRLRRVQALSREVTSAARGVEQHLYGDARHPRESLSDLLVELDELTRVLDREEDALVAALVAASGPESLEALTERYRQAMRHAPTRPHPHFPRPGPLARLALGVVGRADQVLDVMDARAGTGAPVREPAPAGLWGWYLLGRPTESVFFGAEAGASPARRPLGWLTRRGRRPVTPATGEVSRSDL